MSIPPQDFVAAIAHHLKAFRATHGITQPQIQEHAKQRYGATWSRGTVSGFEAGRGTMGVPTLLVLAATLSDLSGESISVGDLIGDASLVELTPRLALSRDGLKDLLGDSPVVLDAEHGAQETWSDSDMSAMVERVITESRFDPPLISGQQSVDDMQRIKNWPITLSVERAAQRLGIPQRALQLWALRLWGQPLDDEAADRAGEGSSAQKRGHVTRKLVQEIKTELERG